MEQYGYHYLPDDNTIVRRSKTNPQFERYDNKLKKWIPDWELSGICSGDIKSIRCETEDEAWSMLHSHE